MKLFKRIALLLLISKIYFLCWWESQILGRGRRKSMVKTGKTVIFPGKSEKLFQFYFGRIEEPLLHILDPYYLSLNLLFFIHVPENVKKPIIFTFFQHFPNLHLSLS